MNYLYVAIEEYKTLRQESLESMKMQQSILGFGIALISIIMTLGITGWKNAFMANIIFLFFLPIVIYLVLIIWAGEVARMFRAGKFLRRIENKINSEFREKSNALEWENWLYKNQGKERAPHQKLYIHYTAIFLLLSFVSLISILIGDFVFWNSSHILFFIIVNVSELILLTLIVKLASKILKEFI